MADEKYGLRIQRGGDVTYVLAIDQGTSSSRAIVYEHTTEVGSAQAVLRSVAEAQRTFDLVLPRTGWVEQDPDTLWQTTIDSAQEALRKAGCGADAIAAVGITNQRETTLLWDRQTGQCVSPAIVWQDRRTAEACTQMAEQQIAGEAAATYIQRTTGLVIDPYFSATKLAWLLAQDPTLAARAAAGELCFGTVDTYLIWRLSDGRHHVTDATNASRTQLFDIHRQCWDEHLLSFHEIPAAIMPEVVDSAGQLGTVAAHWFGAELPICGVAGDQQAALVGQSCIDAGSSKATYGTGCFFMLNVGDTVPDAADGLLTTVAYRVDGQPTYALEGSIFVAGVALRGDLVKFKR